MPVCQCDCGAKFRFPDSAAGRQARCKKCGSIFTIPAEADDIYDVQELKEEHRAVLNNAATAIPAVQVAAPARSGGGVTAGFAASLLRAFLFPLTKDNLPTLLIVLIILLAPRLLTLWLESLFLIPCFGLLFFVVIVIVAMWFAAFKFEVIEMSAEGDERMPEFGISGGLLEDLVYPAFKWIGSWFVVLAPAIAYTLYALANGTWTRAQIGSLTTPLALARLDMVLAVLVGVGMFLWPMVVLCIGLGGFQALHRFDLMFLTILRTFVGYILTVAAVLGAAVLAEVLYKTTDLAVSSTGGGSISGFVGQTILLMIMVQAITLYLDLVTMRVIGLYFYHMKHRFAWSWE